MEPYEELLNIADRFDQLAANGNKQAVIEPVEALKTAATNIGNAFSGSWHGYHAKVYYAGLVPPPPGAHFSQEWGLMDRWVNDDTSGNWREYDSETVDNAIREAAGHPDLTAANSFNDAAIREIDALKSDLFSILETELDRSSDPFLNRVKDEAEGYLPLTSGQVIEHLKPRGEIMTRDTVILGQGMRVPPHIAALAEATAIQHTIGTATNLANCARKAGSHLSRTRRKEKRETIIGTNVFIGHGRSLLWRELKDFIEDTLKLPVDEFNRVPVAGITNIARLAEMMDAAVFSFLILTGEDEQPDGRIHARMNVIHEAGLFQGKLGFTRAIVLLEEGCEEFSNIAGLGQIRFPKGNIKAAFEDIRQVLSREGVISAE